MSDENLVTYTRTNMADMNDIELRVLRILIDSPRTVFRDDAEKQALACMALYIWHPVSDVYEVSGNGLIAKITDAGRQAVRNANGQS